MSDPSDHPPRLFQELKRRRVFRATAVYVVVAVATVEAADLFFPRLQLPDWTVTLVVALAVLGLPVTVALSWVFDIRPPAAPEDSDGSTQAEPSTARFEAPPDQISPALRGRRAGTIAAVGGAIVLALAGASWVVFGGEDSHLVEDRVAVSVFDNRTGDPSLDPIGDMVLDWVTRGLMRAPSLQVVPPEGVLRARAADGEDSRDSGLAEATGAGMIVDGSYYLQGDSVWFEAKVTDARRDRLLLALDPISAPRERPLDGVEVLRRKVAGAIAQLIDPALGQWVQYAGEPPSYEAYEAYSLGMKFFLSGDRRGALPHLLQAYAEDSTYVTPLIYAASAYSGLHEWDQADSLWNLVEPARDDLSPMDRWHYDLQRASRRGDHEQVRRLGYVAMERFPGAGMEYYAGMQAYHGNRPQETVSLLEQIDPDRGWVGKSLTYWTHLAAGHHLLGSFEVELEVAEQIWDRFPDRRLESLAIQARALSALGRFEALDEKIRAAEEMGARLTEQEEVNLRATLRPSLVGEILQETARELDIHGHADKARALRDRALSWFEARQITRGGNADFRYNYAVTLFDAGRSEEAQTVLEGLVQEHPEPGNWDEVEYHGYLGLVAAARGDSATVAGQIMVLEDFATWYRIRGLSKAWLALIAAQRREPARAVTLLEQALDGGISLGFHMTHQHASFELGPIRGYPPLERLLEPRG